MKEIWKDIPKYEKMYRISNYGNIKSYDRITKGRKVKGKNIKPIYKNGSYCVVLRNSESNPKCYLIHRLVIEIFGRPNIDNEIVRHIDGNPANNRIDNLCYGNTRENRRDYFLSDTAKQAKLTIQQVKEIKQLLKNCGRGELYDIAKKYNTTYDTIWNIKSGRTWSYVE